MLTDTRVRTTKPCQRPIKLSDSGGLYLLITAHGSKLWRLAYRFGGKQKTLAIGAYPTFTLKAARDKREEAKRLLANGIDPSMRQFCGLRGMSASLIGHSRSSAFRLSAAEVSMSLTGSCFSSESAPRPLYGAFLVKKFKQGSASFFLRQLFCSI